MEADLTVTGDLMAVQGEFELRGWADGLPIIPPTVEAVARMLGEWDGEASLGAMPPTHVPATLRTLAANAVMAGCEEAAFPVLVAIFEALLDPAFNLAAVQTTTHPVAPLAIVHGPVAAQLGLNGGPGEFGPGNRGNATIGRAVRLALMNIGGARPGTGDKSTHGSPAKYTFCIAENVAASPWSPFHTSVGFAAEENAVTVVGCEAPQNVQDHESVLASRHLDLLADSMQRLGHNGWAISGGNPIVVVLSPEAVGLLAAESWSRHDVQYYLFHRACRPVRDLERAGLWEQRDWPVWMNALAQDRDALVPPTRRPDEILVLVAGGPGKHSAVLPGFGASHAVSRPVRSVAAL
jgi:hypothetical protein